MSTTSKNARLEWENSALRMETLRAQLAEARAELHKWRTARTHGGCHEDLRAEVATRVDAEDERDAARAEATALREALGKWRAWLDHFEGCFQQRHFGARDTAAAIRSLASTTDAEAPAGEPKHG